MRASAALWDNPVEADPEAPAGPVQPLLVLKFGSSVLETIDDLPAVAGEIYRQRRKGNRIIAVVSALAGETDRLFGEAAAVCGGVACTGAAELISLGEERTAALLRIACDRIGITAAICRPEEMRLIAGGDELDAGFDQLRPFSLLRKLETHGVVIVPGFIGVDEHGRRKLLGRGGSDFTAAILGGELGAETVRLYKDVDGVFERDPAADPAARKLAEVSYDDALRIAGHLVHAKALRFAAERRLAIEVEAIGSSTPTRIGGASRLSASTIEAEPLRIALAGYGTVGQALTRRIARDSRFRIVSVLVRDTGKARAVAPPVPPTGNLDEFATQHADVLIDTSSCERTGAALTAASLRRGVPVMSASKRVLCDGLDALDADARTGRASLLYSAAVGGSAPILEAIDRERRAERIDAVRGVFNGTVNFILHRLSEGVSLDAAIGLARQAGFAEDDCEADLSGADAAAKLKLIACRAFDAAPSETRVSCQRLDRELAKAIQASGERWVQLSEAYLDDGVCARVRIIPLSRAPIPACPDEWNVGVIRRNDGREISVAGRGAGGPATAEAIVADLYDLMRARSSEAKTMSATAAPANSHYATFG